MEARYPLIVTQKLEFYLLIFSFVSMVSCAQPDQQKSTLLINRVSPPYGSRGDVVSLVGGHFGIQGDQDFVTLSGEDTPIRYWSLNRIDVRIPFGIPTGQRIFVLVANGRMSNTIHFDVIQSPIADNESFDMSASDLGSLDAQIIDFTASE